MTEEHPSELAIRCHDCGSKVALYNPKRTLELRCNCAERRIKVKKVLPEGWI